MWYQKLARPLFFHLEPEQAHYAAMDALEKAWAIPGGRGMLRGLFAPETDPSHRVNVFGLDFPHPVGLAAGFDKDARWIDPLAALGFSFIEIGTVTPRAQPGNPKPRLFRLPADEGLINRMGFNNGGAEAAARRLSKRKGKIIIGGNIGKNKDTPNDQAIEDYRVAFAALQHTVDYFVVNVSSPNTPGLRDLQDREPLTRLLNTLQKDKRDFGMVQPILLKIAPDLNEHQLDDIAGLVRETATDGLVCTNTTISRDGLKSDAAWIQSCGAGGLSGAPLKRQSTEVIQYLHRQLGDEAPIIGVGGVRTAEDAREKLDAGARLVQVYTGFIYEGPAIVRNILREL